MPLDIENVQVMEKKKGTNQLVQVKVNPYIRMVREGETPIIIQGGCFYSDGGDKLPTQDLPAWVKKQIKAIDSAGVSSVGLGENWEGVVDIEAVAEPEVEVQSVKEPEERPSIVDAVYSLDSTNDEFWTKEGKPDLQAVMVKVGRYVSRGEIEELTGHYRRKETKDGDGDSSVTD